LGFLTISISNYNNLFNKCSRMIKKNVFITSGY
jgi:hypothetical protein